MNKRTIAFLVYPDLTALDLIGPLQVLKCLQGRDGFEVVTVGERAAPMPTDTGLQVVPERTFDEVPSPHTIVVPGGVVGPFAALANDALMAWVKRAAAGATFVTSVCTGAFILGAAGLLEGRRATTHWSFLDKLPRVGAQPTEERWVEDGNVITSAGVSAGIDMALALAARLAGEGVARTIQLSLEYDPHPPFGGIDRSKVDVAEMQRQFEAVGASRIPQVLAGKPELLQRLFG